MAIKTKNGYACGYCKKEYTGMNGLSNAENCKESHNLIYLQISQQDLQRLIMFIYSKEDALLDDRLIERLQSYMKGAFDYSLVNSKSVIKNG